MLSDFQQKKLARLFSCMDADGNGYMEESDLERIASDLVRSRDLDESDDRASALRDSHAGMWRQIQRFADNGRVPFHGFVAYHDDLLATPGAFDSTIGKLSDLIFSTLDSDGDGHITLDEHRTFVRVYGIDPALADTVFPMWDRDSNGYVSTAELADVVRQFFYSTDPDAPGNWLFGPIFSDMDEARAIEA